MSRGPLARRAVSLAATVLLTLAGCEAETPAPADKGVAATATEPGAPAAGKVEQPGAAVALAPTRDFVIQVLGMT